MWRNVLLLVVFVVAGLCFGVIYLAEHDTFERTREGQRYAGPIESIGPKGIRYLDAASGKPKFLRDPPEAWARQRRVGEIIEVACSTVRCEALATLAPPSRLLFAPMGGLILVGLAFVWLPVRDRRRLRRAGSDPLAVITVLLLKARTQALIAGLLLLAMSGFIVAVMLLDPTSVAGLVVLGLTAAGGLFVAGIFLRKFVGLLDVRNSWILHIITQKPEQIVWIWELVVTAGLGLAKNRTVHICLADGRDYTVPLGQSGAEDFVASLAARAPGAVVGWSKEVEQAFKADPTSLQARAIGG